MKQFKFLRKPNYSFQFEFVLNIDSRHSNNEVYNNLRSNVVKNWLSFYYNERPLGSPCHEYLVEIDRVCEIMECGVVTCGGVNCFDAKVKMSKSDFEYLIIDLRYPIEDIIEYEKI